MPPEWARHERCWMAWPCLGDRWPCGLEAARAAHLDVAHAISGFEPVTILAPPEEVADLGVQVSDEPIEILPMPLHDGWFRDTGPTFLINGRGDLAGVNWMFNGWGTGKKVYDDDRDLAAALLKHLGLPCYDAPIVSEGGAIHTDGEGTLLCVESAIVDKARNPENDRGEIESVLMDYTGTEKVIWLPQGYEQDETGGHVDIVACFAAPGVVLANSTEDQDDPNYAVYHENRQILEKARDARGRVLEVVDLPQPQPVYGEDGCRLSLSYMNFYIANGGIVAPAFEQPSDKDALQILRQVFPGYEVVQVPAADIFSGGGGIHCITQQQPAVASNSGNG